MTRAHDFALTLIAFATLSASGVSLCAQGAPRHTTALSAAPSYDADSDPSDGVRPTASEWRTLVVLPFVGAAGAQIIRSPEAWERTWEGYGYRLADQTGFLVVEESVRRGLRAAIGPAATNTSCWRPARGGLSAAARGVSCAVASTVVERAPDQSRRLNVPTIASVLVATGVSLAWRPERTNAAKARNFVLVRTGVVFGGLAATRLYTDVRSTPPATPNARSVR
jgi:hypothetical protein